MKGLKIFVLVVFAIYLVIGEYYMFFHLPEFLDPWFAKMIGYNPHSKLWILNVILVDVIIIFGIWWKYFKD